MADARRCDSAADAGARCASKRSRRATRPKQSCSSGRSRPSTATTPATSRCSSRKPLKRQSARDRGAPRRGAADTPELDEGGDRGRRVHQSLSEAGLQAARRAAAYSRGRRATAGLRSAAAGKVQVEFVSANPTGPLHVGHGRAGGARRRDRRAARSAGPRGHARVLLQRCRRADRDPRALGAGARAGHQAGRGRAGREEGYARRIHRGHRHANTVRGNGDAEDLRGDPPVRASPSLARRAGRRSARSSA